jgi:hypothetical protein
VEFLDQVNLSKGALAEFHDGEEIARAYLLLYCLAVHLLKHVIILPDFDELLLPFLLLGPCSTPSSFSSGLFLLFVVAAFLLSLLLL